MADEEREKKPTAGKFKKAIKTSARQLEDAYQAMGARAYRLYKDGKIKHEDLIEVATEIDALIGVIGENQVELDKVVAERKGIKCPYCEAKSAPGSRFCPGCGRDLPLPSDLKETEKVPCPHCAKPVPEATKFCPHCGKKV
ncbi:MAG TPA: zinc ribbon domain-containing protein [Candidatus Anoxymicrobiaceae bacterium]|jgi:DNA-directed RNA polymerase subunit RPC12/RpoP